ncbi:MAG: PrgI family protein [Neglectibacter timonensis]
MPYVTIPKDLTKVKTKVLFNLTKRQLVCFSAGLLVGVPLFFLTKEPLGNSTAALLMILTMLPAFLLALYEKNGQHLEVIIRNMVRVLFLRPKERPYRTNNFYAVLERQDNPRQGGIPDCSSIAKSENRKKRCRPLSQSKANR